MSKPVTTLTKAQIESALAFRREEVGLKKPKERAARRSIKSIE
jgi:hypothetical protein